MTIDAKRFRVPINFEGYKQPESVHYHIADGLCRSAEYQRKHMDKETVIFEGMHNDRVNMEYSHWLIETELMHNLYVFLHREASRYYKTGMLSAQAKAILIVPDAVMGWPRFVGVSSEIVAKAILTIMDKAAGKANLEQDGYPFDIRFHVGKNSRAQDVIYVRSQEKAIPAPSVEVIEKDKKISIKEKKQTRRKNK